LVDQIKNIVVFNAKEMSININKEKKNHQGKMASKSYYQNNKEKYKIWNKEHRERHKEKTKERCKNWREKNKEHVKDYSKNRYEENKEHLKEKKKIWREKNKEKILEYRRSYTKNRRKNDPLFKLITNLRNRVNLSFRRNGYTKKSKTYGILGCSYDEFKTYLENKFVDNMNWSNQGEWHLDHIIPVSSGRNENEIIKLNHYTNFQPLWGIDNLIKGNKI
jgi:hypothetical protein